MSATTEKPGLFGLLAEFETTQQVYDAANLVRKEGFTKAEAYSPFPIDGLWEAIGHKRTMLPTLIFCGGLLGAVTAFILQTLTSGSHPDSLDPLLDGTVSTLTGNMLSFNYRMNIAGRPFFSWPAFIPPIFEMMILFSRLPRCLACFCSTAIRNRIIRFSTIESLIGPPPIAFLSASKPPIPPLIEKRPNTSFRD